MLDAVAGDQSVRQGTDSGGIPAQNKYFQAVVMVKMHVHRRDDHVVMIVLDIHETAGKIIGVMIIDECQRPRDLAFQLFPLILNKRPADEVTYGLRTVRVAFAAAEFIERQQQILTQGNAETGKIGQDSFLGFLKSPLTEGVLCIFCTLFHLTY